MTTHVLTPDAAAALVLRDGSAVRIQQLTGADAELLADGFARLSATSRWYRFLTSKTHLSSAELRYLTDIDHHNHEALVAVSLIDERALGVARYVRSAEDPRVAEVAVTVVDEWHERGLGTELVTRLIDRAVEVGIQRFTALIAAENVAVIKLLRKMSVEYRLVADEYGTLEYEITLPPRRVSAA